MILDLINSITKNKRSMLIWAVGIISFITATVSLVASVLELAPQLSILISGEHYLQLAGTATLGIDLVFAALEIATGFALIKAWDADDIIEVHKTMAKLIQIVVYENLVEALAGELIARFVPGMDGEPTLGMFYILIYAAYFILLSSLSPLVKRGELMKLYYLMAASSLIAVGFSVMDTVDASRGGETLDIGLAIGNVLITLCILAFAVGTVIYYLVNPDELRHDTDANVDYDVIRRTEKHEYVRIYTNRADEGGVNVLINVLYLLAIALGLAASVLFVMERNADFILADTLVGVIDAIISEFKSLSLSSSFDIMMILLIGIFAPLMYVGAAYGILKRSSNSKISLVFLSGIGTRILFFSALFIITDVFMSFARQQSLSALLDLPLAEAATVVIFVIYNAALKLGENKSNDLMERIQEGDSYRTHIKEIRAEITREALFSFASLGVMFTTTAIGGVYNTSYILYALSSLLIMIGTHLEYVYPFAEYVTVKHRIRGITED